MIFIGIDPGKTGAFAYRANDGWHVHDCPTMEIKVGKKVKEVLDAAGMAALFEVFHRDEIPIHVYIEKVSAMPGQGVTSMFSFGMGYGMWQGIIAAFGIPHTFVTPQAWKKAMMPGMGKEKDASRVRALQLWPEARDLLARKKDNGRADAMLIAAYGARQNP